MNVVDRILVTVFEEIMALEGAAHGGIQGNLLPVLDISTSRSESYRGNTKMKKCIYSSLESLGMCTSVSDYAYTKIFKSFAYDKLLMIEITA